MNSISTDPCKSYSFSSANCFFASSASRELGLSLNACRSCCREFLRGNCADGSNSRLTRFQRCWFEHSGYPLAAGRRQERLFEDIQERSRAIDSVALCIASGLTCTATPCIRIAEYANVGAKHQLRRLFDSKAILPYTRFGLGGRMTVLTITAKGQVTLKQDLLKHLGVSPGEKIEADKLPDGRIVVSGGAGWRHY